MLKKREEEKRNAAKRAIDYIPSNSIIGLGSGSTANFAITFIGQAIREGRIKDIKAVSSSFKSEQLAKKEGIPLIDINAVMSIDVTLDGADEFDPYFNLIKGGGGALVREKIIASISQQFIVMVDAQKQVPFLGNFPLPIEVMKFSAHPILYKLEKLNLYPILRLNEHGAPFLSDNNNFIIDLHLSKINNPVELSQQLQAIPGIIDHGLFINYADIVIMGKDEQVIIFEK